MECIFCANSTQGRFRFVSHVTDTRLERTSPSADVFKNLAYELYKIYSKLFLGEAFVLTLSDFIKKPFSVITAWLRKYMCDYSMMLGTINYDFNKEL